MTDGVPLCLCFTTLTMCLLIIVTLKTEAVANHMLPVSIPCWI